ncbi:MAG TPA: hypothetical protein VGQ94_06175, partial [Terriglobales bacterium]|nr:hypothetical protein [Terriglobales bacterium]
IVSLVGLAAWASDTMVPWKSQQLKLDNVVRAGSVVLPAGEYRVTHEMQGTQHILVMALTGRGKQTFRVPCTMQPLVQAAAQTEQHYRFEGKERILVGLVFKGDKVFHAF